MTATLQITQQPTFHTSGWRFLCLNSTHRCVHSRARKLEVFYLFRLNLIWRQGTTLGFTLECKANSGFIFIIVVLVLHSAWHRISHHWKEFDRALWVWKRTLFLFFFFFDVTLYTSRESLHICQEHWAVWWQSVTSYMQLQSSGQALLSPATKIRLIWGGELQSKEVSVVSHYRHKPLAWDCSNPQISVQGAGWFLGRDVSTDRLDRWGLV